MDIITDRKQDAAQVVRAAVKEHGMDREHLIPILHEANMALGYLSEEALAEISRQMRIPKSQVLSVASFYHMLYIQPTGEHVIKVCDSAPCHVMGGNRLLRVLKTKFNIVPEQTSEDGKWTLIRTSCLGVCGVGPVMMVDDDVYGSVQPDEVEAILARYQDGREA
jgi:NADH:ubiquinone oxidoreductase subunit E